MMFIKGKLIGGLVLFLKNVFVVFFIYFDNVLFYGVVGMGIEVELMVVSIVLCEDGKVK